ncbi:fatty acid desaturase [Pedobacter hartonius]|uniref:Stearoyl-CoA desaturase (Delta-9 desaturase) n=1 Tax=Pedobacter hartonius TaxID=425514 RepID=A0A1H4BDU7_9SPHI|nr:fatty acid desaturase [Pedobacter hartonius]SEA46224.1 stearoyl-CoA desaturase (delta-9 desaturase) [Pedobacter hartonius]
MTFLNVVLDPPAYGWTDTNGNLSKPTPKQILTEFFSRLNIFKNKKNWLPFMSWSKVIVSVPFLMLFIFEYFSWSLLAVAFVYSMIIMGTHGTIWHHRYCTHNSYTFKNKFWRFITQNLTISMIPEEIYVVSHHVHHAKSDAPGDPYNASGGFLYCFLADVNHQPIAKNLIEKDYRSAVKLMVNTGVTANTYEQYLKWGSIANPWRTILSWSLNWLFWGVVFFLIGGPGLVCAVFGAAGVWAVGVRTFNYEGHGKGKDMRRDNYDFSRDDMSINQLWPGYVAGEWHNNHHLYPVSARTGFLPHQFDLAWCYIWTMHKLGPVSSLNDSKGEFLENHFNKK